MSAEIQIIEKEDHAQYAVVPIEEWRRICALAEDAKDIQAADTAGIGKSHISQIESSAKNGSVRCLRQLAEALRVDIDDLVRQDDQ